MSFDVVVTRFDARGGESAAALLELLLGFEHDQAEAVLSRLPAVVLARTSREQASMLADQLRKIGAEVQVVQAERRADKEPRTAKRAGIREVFAAREDTRDTLPRLGAAERPPVEAVSAQAAARPHNGSVEPARAAQPLAQAAPAAVAMQGLFGSAALALHSPAQVLAPDQALEAQAHPPQAHAQAASVAAVAPAAFAQPPVQPVAFAPAPAEGAIPAEAAGLGSAFEAERALRARETADMIAGVERDLGAIDFSRFDSQAPPRPLAAQAPASAFGGEPLFADKVAQPMANAADLLADFDALVNKPLDLGGPTKAPGARAASALDADIEGLFSAPVRTPKQAAKPRAAAAPATHSARQEGPPPVAPEITLIEQPKPSRAGLLIKAGLGLVALSLVGVVVLAFSDPGGGAATSADSADVHVGAARDEDTSLTPLHPLIQLAPKGIDRSMAMVLRELVTGLHKVQIEVDSLPADVQCVLIKAEDGRANLRIKKLLRTGMRVPLDDMTQATFDEHEQSLRFALGDQVKFKRLCLSMDLYEEKMKSRAPSP